MVTGILNTETTNEEEEFHHSYRQSKLLSSPIFITRTSVPYSIYRSVSQEATDVFSPSISNIGVHIELQLI